MSVKADVRAAIAAAKQQMANVGLTFAQERKLKAKLRKVAPSEPWVETQICSSVERDRKGHPFVRRYHDSRVFPPGGSQTKMRRCSQCRRWTPPQCFEKDACLDHSEHVGWGPSPSAVAIAQMEYFNRQEPEVELAMESIEALKSEIEQHVERHGSGSSLDRSSPA